MTNPEPVAESYQMSRLSFDQLVRQAGGEPSSPGDEDSFLESLYDEAAQEMGNVRVECRTDRTPPHAEVSKDGYLITFDPNFKPLSHIDTAAYLRASIVHELLHVSTDRKYQHTDPDLQFGNFHLPGKPDSQEFIESYLRQANAADQNFTKLSTIANQEAQSGVLPDNLHQHLQNRITYGQAAPHVHYDTVLADIAIYMTSRAVGAKDTDTYRYVKQLSEEAQTRRIDGNILELKIQEPAPVSQSQIATAAKMRSQDWDNSPQNQSNSNARQGGFPIVLQNQSSSPAPGPGR